MNENIELEYKVMITDEQYETLLQLYPPVEKIVQINHYFDDYLFTNLNSHKVIRIREFPDSFEFTMKYYDSEGNLHELSKKMKDLLLPQDKEIVSFLENCGIAAAELREFACLKTIRQIHRDEYGELCLDESFYGNVRDLELEYEQISSCDDFFLRFQEIIKKAGIDYQPSKPKVMRCYLNYLQQQHN